MLLPNPVFRIVVSNRRRRDQSRNDQKYAAHHDAARSHSFSVNFFRSSAAILSASSCAFLVCLGAVTTVGRQPRTRSRRTPRRSPVSEESCLRVRHRFLVPFPPGPVLSPVSH